MQWIFLFVVIKEAINATDFILSIKNSIVNINNSEKLHVNKSLFMRLKAETSQAVESR